MLTESLFNWVSKTLPSSSVALPLTEQFLGNASTFLSLYVQGTLAHDYFYASGRDGMDEVGFQWLRVLEAVLATFLLVYLYRLAFVPMDRVRSMVDVGWGFLKDENTGGRSIAERVNELQRLRKKGDLPPVYPNGWFAVAESRQLKTKQAITVEALGQTLAVFRDANGECHVLDAHCPHLGANLAVGGVVKGDCLECPFHGWLFRGQDGACAHIPYANKLPDFAKVKRWESREVNGHVFIWHHAEGLPPTWHLAEVPQIADGRWHYRGRTQHDVLAHIQEIPENGADIAHLAHVHVPSIFKGSDLTQAFANNKVLDVAKHQWSGEWEALEGSQRHMAKVNLHHTFALFGGLLKLFSMNVVATQIGPGLVHLHFDTSLGRGVLVQTVTPIEPLRQRLCHQFYSSSSFIAPYAKFVLLCEAYHVERDIMVWNSKQYLSRPLLVAEDRLIPKFRKWYKQFYSENSPKYSFQKDSYDW